MVRALQAPALVDPPLLKDPIFESNWSISSPKTCRTLTLGRGKERERGEVAYREGGEAVGATVVERDPLIGVGATPQDEVAVEELEGGRAVGVEVLDEGDGVPVVSP